MNWKLKIAVVVLGSGVLPLFASAASSLPESWYHQTALVDGKQCAAAPTLYRSVRMGYFTLGRVAENMIGDELAEYPSYKFLTLLHKDIGHQPTLEDWNNEKRIAADQLANEVKNQPLICDFGDTSASLTVLGGAQASKDESFGIPSTPDLKNASGYFWTERDIILEINEKVPRAAMAVIMTKVGSSEYYIPIVIPARDISGAWNQKYYMKKIERADGQIDSIEIRQSSEIEEYVPPEAPGTIVARIIPCDGGETCQSSASLANDPDLAEIQTSLTFELSRGFRFKMVTPN